MLYVVFGFFRLPGLLDKADELAGEHNGQKRVDDLAKGDVSQRQRENDDVAEEDTPTGCRS